MPHDDQEGAGDRDQCLELAAALDDPAVTLAEEAVGAGGCCSDLAEDAFETSDAFSCQAAIA